MTKKENGGFRTLRSGYLRILGIISQGFQHFSTWRLFQTQD